MPKVSTTYTTLSPVALPMDMYMSNVRPTWTADVAATLPQLTSDIAATCTKKAAAVSLIPQLSADVVAMVTHKASIDAELNQLVAALFEVESAAGGGGPARIGDGQRHAITRGIV